MLTRASVLHYWDARFGPVPIVGGAPHHTRSSAARWIDPSGVIQGAIVNTPRFERGVIVSERRPVLRLERAGANIADVDLGSWTLGGGMSRTSGQPDPAGGTGAYLFTGNESMNALRATPFTGNATKAIGVCVKRVDAAGSDVQLFGLFDATAPAWRIFLPFTWPSANGPPSFAGGTGVALTPVELIDGWYGLVLYGPGIVAANTNQLVLWTQGATGTRSALFYLPQAENAPVPSSLMSVLGTRAAEEWYWDHATAVQTICGYVRFIERGTINQTTDCRVLQIGHASDSNPRCGLYMSSATQRYGLFFITSGGTRTAVLTSAAPVVGDTVELAWILHPAAGIVTVIQSVNGAAVSSATNASSLALPSAWSDTRLWLNSIGGAQTGQNDFAEVKHVKLADLVASPTGSMQDVMNELRAFELSAAGEVIV